MLPQLLNGYNQTSHRSIGMAAQDVTDDNERVVWTKLYGKRLKRRPRPKLKVGDRVRLSTKHRPFKKGYLPGWTEGDVWCEVLWLLITWKNGMARPWKGVFTSKMSKKSPCQMTLCSEWKKFYNDLDTR